jgi:16S rRNA (guanine(966)-N(2))-methyltransferase RsmD
MRIIRGKHRGRHISVPTNFQARPTTDIAKEALFNILDNTIDFSDMRILDLFSGTGSISYEFLSRGCKAAEAVENNKKYADFIRKTGEELFPGQMKVYHADAFEFIKKRQLSYHIIFADPPYELPEIDKIPDEIFSNPTLLPDCDVIIEHSGTTDFSKHPKFVKLKKYGKVHFSFFLNQSSVEKTGM